MLPLLVFSLFASCILAEDGASPNLPTPLKQPEQWQNDLVDWLMSKPNGFFSEKVLWTKTEMGYNMHAAEDIFKDETIMVIPQDALITSDGTEEECVTINKMMQEYDKGDQSDYYPYIRYLFGGHEGGTSPGLLPTTWSAPAKNLLRMIVGDDLSPKNFEKGHYKVLQSCKNFIPNFLKSSKIWIPQPISGGKMPLFIGCPGRGVTKWYPFWT